MTTGAGSPDYDALRRSRDWTWEQMAAHVERQGDPALARKLRRRQRPKGTERAVNTPPETRG